MSMTEGIPNGTIEDVRTDRNTRHIDFVWRDKKFSLELRPLTWGVEKEAVSRCGDRSGIDVGAFVDFILEKCVESSSVPLKLPERPGLDPDFVWCVAREAGILQRLTRLGVHLTSGETTRVGIRSVLEQFLLIERRLRREGWSPDEFASLPAEEVLKLYTLSEQDRVEEVEASAAIFAKVVAQRLGAG